MPISNLNTRDEHQNNLGHFATIVKLALADNNINHDEQIALDRMAKSLQVSKDEYVAVLNNPEAYPIIPPATQGERLERLYNLTRMVYADHEILGVEVSLLKKVAVDLGFPAAHAAKITEKAIYLIINNYDLEGFMGKVNAMTF